MLNLDTHILIHALSGEISKKEKLLLSENQWCISSIVLWEITKLSQLKRIELSLDDDTFLKAISSITIHGITLDICKTLSHLDFRSDPADEMIAATSMFFKIPLLTRDKKILKSKIVPIAK